MALYLPTYDGNAIFGAATRMKMLLNPTAQQINAFFGVSGQQAIYGGSRGRTFMVEGLWIEDDPATIRASDEALLLSYADGIARTLTDTFGASWDNVIFKAEYSHGDLVFNPNGGGGYGLPFKCVFHGLT